jgi:hypothetical protein
MHTASIIRAMNKKAYFLFKVQTYLNFNPVFDLVIILKLNETGCYETFFPSMYSHLYRQILWPGFIFFFLSFFLLHTTFDAVSLSPRYSDQLRSGPNIRDTLSAHFQLNPRHGSICKSLSLFQAASSCQKWPLRASFPFSFFFHWTVSIRSASTLFRTCVSSLVFNVQFLVVSLEESNYISHTCSMIFQELFSNTVFYKLLLAKIIPNFSTYIDNIG